MRVLETRIEQTINYGGGTEWPRGIVDQDDSVAERCQSGADAVRSFGAANDEIADVAVAERGARQILLTRADHDPH